jgi:hypothetical protein
MGGNNAAEIADRRDSSMARLVAARCPHRVTLVARASLGATLLGAVCCTAPYILIQIIE